LRKLDPATLRFEIERRFPEKIVLKPPLGQTLRGVLIDGRTCTDFDAESVTLPRIAAEVICFT
jgi:hypothetical protein